MLPSTNLGDCVSLYYKNLGVKEVFEKIQHNLSTHLPLNMPTQMNLQKDEWV